MDSNIQERQNTGRSEIKRYRPDFLINQIKDTARFSYYTLLSLNLNGKIKKLQFKLDTGSPYTIIGLDLLKRNGIDLTQELENTGFQEELFDASGRNVRIAPYIVQSFKLTEEITLNDVQIYISPDIENRAVLGMDLLSLFDFQYQWEVNSMLGTFWINNYVTRRRFIEKMLAEKNLKILDSKQLFLLERK
ncbi:MAG: retroviral-like aspartic protease family protein [Lachnospiraceae bacterium]